MNRIAFFVPGNPQGKARARTVRQGGVVRSYTPKKTADYERLVKKLSAEAMEKAGNSDLTEEPLTVIIEADFPIPKSFTKAKKKSAEEGELLPTKKPDLDNIAKAILDGMNGIVYKDDAQVVCLVLRKVYVPGNEGVNVMIRNVEAYDEQWMDKTT